MKAIICAVWLILFAPGCAYFRWESDRPWNAPANTDEPATRSSSIDQLNDSHSASKSYK